MFQAHVMRLAAQEKASVRAKEIVKEAVGAWFCTTTLCETVSVAPSLSVTRSRTV